VKVSYKPFSSQIDAPISFLAASPRERHLGMALAPRKPELPSLPPQDLSSDSLLQYLPRVDFNGQSVPLLGKIPLLSRLGKGAMGAVYYGVHPRLKIEVAVKVLQSSLAQQNPDLIERFYREAQTAARVSSRHLVHVSDVDEECGLFYITMEFVRGLSGVEFLKRELKRGKPGLDECDALDVVIAATRGLAAAHDESIIHRDVKPANIMIPLNKNGETYDLELSKLADLGLARPENQDAGLTGAYQAIGTPGFMAPEQIEDASRVGKPADVFAMGATLHALLTATTPFPGTSQVVVFSKTLKDPHLRVDEKRPDVSLGTISVIDRCLSKDPARRYADGEALLEALKKCRQELTGSGVQPPKKTSEGTSLYKKTSKRRQTQQLGAPTIPSTAGTPVPAAKIMAALPPKLIDESTVVNTAPPVAPKPAAPPPGADKTALTAAVQVTLPGVPPPKLEAYKDKIPMLFPFDAQEARRRRKEISERLGLPASVQLDLPGGIPLQLQLIPPGEFLMGSPASEDFRANDEYNHYARMTRPYYIGTTPVTQEQWQAVAGFNNSRFKDLPDSPRRPVEKISWLDIQQKFLPVIQSSATAGWKFRLPSEAEWENACRAGTETAFNFGLSISMDKLNCKEDATSGNDWKWVYRSDTGSTLRERGQTSPVGIFPPNAWGLSDMHGNVWEWCEDWYSEQFYNNQPCVDPLNTEPSDERVLRGGGFNYTARYCRAACRYHSQPDSRNFSFGFRLALVMA